MENCKLCEELEKLNKQIKEAIEWNFGYCPSEPWIDKAIEKRTELENHKCISEEFYKMRRALKKCRKLIDDIMPQIGKLSIQDYQNLNEALMESSEVLNDNK